MKRYRITYIADNDPGCPEFACVYRAHNREDAMDRFFETDCEGWEILKVEEVRS